jgi:hypothetical protein
MNEDLEMKSIAMAVTTGPLAMSLIKMEHSLARIAQALESIAKHNDPNFKTHGEITAERQRAGHQRRWAITPALAISTEPFPLPKALRSEMLLNLR